MSTFYTLLTTIGEAKLANATALGLPFVIRDMAVGDGGGTTPTPSPAQTALTNELRRAPLNSLDIDPDNPSAILAEQVIPEAVGGWWIRELCLYDDDGDVVAVGNCPPTYKPLLTEGSGRTQVIRMLIVVSSTANVTLKVDPSVVLATRELLDREVLAVGQAAAGALAAHKEASDPHPQYMKAEDAQLEENDKKYRLIVLSGSLALEEVPQ